MRHQTTVATTMLLGLLVIVAGGCTTKSELYVGHDPDHVWTAMVAAAESPSHYDDWFIIENEVWADDANSRIEIHRTIKRDLVLPMAHPQRQERTMQFQVNLLTEEGEPEVEFVSRHLDVPAKARYEARMYFDEVWGILGGRPAEVTDEHDEADDAGDAADDDAVIDVDDVG